MIPVEVTQAPWHATGFWDWVDHWQTLIAGVLAFAAGVGTVVVAIKVIAATREQTATTVRLEEKRVADEIIAIRTSLAIEMRRIIDNVSRTCLILKNPSVTPMAPSELIRLTDFSTPIVYPATADRLARLGPLAVDVSTLYANVERLTFSARIVASGPNEQIPPSELAQLVDSFERTCRAYLPLLNAIPVNDDDAKLRARIEGMGKSA